MPESFNHNGRNGNGWYLRREISFSHLITTALVVVSVMKFGYDMDKRVALLEARINYSEVASNRSLSAINLKLDKIIEK